MPRSLISMQFFLLLALVLAINEVALAKQKYIVKFKTSGDAARVATANSGDPIKKINLRLIEKSQSELAKFKPTWCRT